MSVTNEQRLTVATFSSQDPTFGIEKANQQSLSSHVEQAVRQYFSTLAEEEPTQLYEIMLSQLEKPLLKVVLEQTRGNQSRTAEILGLNRGTLRKKLKTYNLM